MYDLERLPSPALILEDFLAVGGSFKQLLLKHVKEQQQKIGAIKILECLEGTPHKSRFEQIRRNSQQVESMLVEDELIELSHQPSGRDRISAIRLLLDRQKQQLGINSEVGKLDNLLDKLKASDE